MKPGHGPKKRTLPCWASLILFLLAAVPFCPLAQAGQAELEVTGFQAQTSQPAQLGSQVRVEFTLRNASARTLKLGSPLGVFLAAKVALPGSAQPLRRNFGKQLAGGQLAPGQSHHFSESLLLDLHGSWTLLPACQLAEEMIFFEQQGQTLQVGQGAAAPLHQDLPRPAPPQPAAAPLAPPAKQASGPAPAPGTAASAATCSAGQLCIKVLSYNIDSLTPGKNPAGWSEFMHILAQEKPDLLVLQEAVTVDLPAVARAAGLLYQAGVSAYGPEDWRGRVGVFSRWPLRVKPVPLPVTDGDKERKFGQCEVDLEGIPLAFYAMHLSRQGLVDSKLKGLVKEMLGVGRREEEMATVVRELKRDNHRFKILAGDLNTFPLSGPYRLLEEQLQDAFPAMAPGSYRMDKMRTGDKAKVDRAFLDNLPNPKIDHVFHSQALRPLEARVIPEGPSDHYPVTATLRLEVADHQLSPQRVKTAQEALVKLGLMSGPAQAVMTPASRRAVAALQAKKGLPVDGMLDDQTLRLLGR